MDKSGFPEKFRSLFEAALKDFFRQKERETANFPKVIKEALKLIKDLTLSGGKRIRPALLYYSYLSFGGKTFSQIRNYCLSIELLHTSFLIHDDIMDRASLRRGQKTVIKYYKDKFRDHDLANSFAILCGDLAFSFADELFHEKKSDNMALNKLFSDLKNEVIYGQFMDIAKPQSQKEVIKMMILKTAGYTIEKPLLLGALLAGAQKKQLDSISVFGLKIGLAFQIQDDIFGVFGSKKNLGKSALTDMTDGKKTLLYQKTIEKLDEKDKSIFDNIWGNPRGGKKELAIIRGLIRQSGGLSSCLIYYNSIYKEARGILGQSSLPAKFKDAMLNIVNQILVLREDKMIISKKTTKYA